MDATAYARQLKALLPTGPLWLREVGSWVHKTMLALSDELARVDARGVDLLTESDPRTADETLADWERVLGLPDTCIAEIPATTAERQVAITQKLARMGGQTPAYFVQLAAACGYTVTVNDSYGANILRAGFLAGSASYGEAWAYAWSLDVQPPAGTALSHAELECILNRAAPAHTTLVFNYL